MGLLRNLYLDERHKLTEICKLMELYVPLFFIHLCIYQLWTEGYLRRIVYKLLDLRQLGRVYIVMQLYSYNVIFSKTNIEMSRAFK